MTETFGWNMFAESWRRQQLQQGLGDGLKAFVKLYYDNYTDAEHLEPDIIELLERLQYEAGTGVDIEDVVREAEEELNNEGGVEGSDGTKHNVRTYGEEEN